MYFVVDRPWRLTLHLIYMVRTRALIRLVLKLRRKSLPLLTCPMFSSVLYTQSLKRQKYLLTQSETRLFIDSFFPLPSPILQLAYFPPHFPFLGFQMGQQKLYLKNIFIRSSIRSFSCYINECANYANLLIAHRARFKGGRKRHIYIGSPLNFILRSINRLISRKSSMVYFLPLMVDFFQAQFCNLAPFYWTYSSPRFGAWRVWKLPWWIWWAQG